MSQKVIVFGASGGVGSVLCQQLVDDGHQLILAGRNEEKLSELGNRLQQSVKICDGTQLAEVEQVITDAKEDWGVIDGVVNLIGSIMLKPAHLLTEKDFHNCLQTNLMSAFAVVRSLTKCQMDKPSVTVLMSTAAAHLGMANHEAIAAAKMGVEGLMKAAACSYAKNGLRFNCVAPGLTKTPLTERIFANEKGREYSQSLHPVGRLGKPEDIANAIRFLLSKDNDWISGQVFTIDGGLSTLKS